MSNLSMDCVENLPKALVGVHLLRWIATYPVDKGVTYQWSGDRDKEKNYLDHSKNIPANKSRALGLWSKQ